MCGYCDNLYWQWLMTSSPEGPYQGILRHTTFLIMCKYKVQSVLLYYLYHYCTSC